MAITSLNSTDSGAVSRVVINDNFTDLDTNKADLASPTFTGVPAAPTASPGTSTTQLATTAFATAAGSAAIAISTAAGTTLSLTTTAGQRVIVWAKGGANAPLGSPGITVYLKYNNVTKDSLALCATDQAGAGSADAFALQYTETPGAGTQNITVETSAGSIADVVIIAMVVS